MAFSMNLRDLASPQYAAVTGRKRKVPYTSYLTAMGPSVRAAAQQETADTLREKELLQNSTQFDTAQKQSQQQFDASQALERTQLGISEEQAQKSAEIQGVHTAITATALANQAGLINLKDVAAPVVSTVKDAASTIGTPLKDAATAAYQKIFPSAPPETPALPVTDSVTPLSQTTPMTTAEATALENTSLAQTAAAKEAANEVAAASSSYSPATAEYASTAAAAEAPVAPAATGGPTAGGAAGVLAIIYAADALRKKYGNTNVPMEERSNKEKNFSTPVVSSTPIAWLSDQLPDDSKFAKSTTASRNLEEGIAGRPLDKAFEGDIVGSVSELWKGVKEAPGQLWDAAKNFATSNPMADLGRKYLGDTAGNIMEFANPVAVISKACIIVTACTFSNSEEVNISREYRDKFLTPVQLRGYYMIAEKVVPLINRFSIVKRLVKRFLVDNLIAYGKHELQKGPPPRTAATTITRGFLALCEHVGNRKPSFVRCNGEIV
ncbi:MAG: hypothetical protein NT047_07475 [Deltaproteobacteria bacterium]|nr:hypothetical protein [Deltaproteobacteria bacterium]